MLLQKFKSLFLFKNNLRGHCKSLNVFCGVRLGPLHICYSKPKVKLYYKNFFGIEYWTLIAYDRLKYQEKDGGGAILTWRLFTVE